jgi:hypothetical protein
LEVICLVDEIEVSENMEALIVLAGTVAAQLLRLLLLCRSPLEIKAPATALASTVTRTILLYWKSKVNEQ